MMIVSYNWTTAALVNGAKTQTWRDWAQDYARKFKPGNLIKGYDRGPRNRGQHVATLRVVSCQEYRSSQMLDSFYETEGLKFYFDHPEMAPKHIFGEPFTPYLVSRERFNRWRQDAEWGYVLTTELLDIIHPAADPYLLPARRIA